MPPAPRSPPALSDARPSPARIPRVPAPSLIPRAPPAPRAALSATPSGLRSPALTARTPVLPLVARSSAAPCATATDSRRARRLPAAALFASGTQVTTRALSVGRTPARAPTSSQHRNGCATFSPSSRARVPCTPPALGAVCKAITKVANNDVSALATAPQAPAAPALKTRGFLRLLRARADGGAPSRSARSVAAWPAGRARSSATPPFRL